MQGSRLSLLLRKPALTRPTGLGIILFVAMLSLGAQAEQADFSERRVLRISAPDLKDDAYREQAARLLPVWAGLIERDFVVETQLGARTFSIKLIGKDGGEKLHRSTPLAPEELFALVDAMPMRRAEIRDRERRRD